MAKKPTNIIMPLMGAKFDYRPKETDWLSTGSTLLNLALSGHPERGFAKGHYFWLVGDSSSGKTFLTMTCMAEAAINPNFNGYRFIFDNAEHGALMDFGQYFGQGMASRIEPPRWQDGAPANSRTIEEFYDNLYAAAQAGIPFIYLLDSMDALNSNYARKKAEEGRKERQGGPKAKGDYGDGKAKYNSGNLRDATADLRPTGSILIVISQTRDDIDAGPFDPQQTHAGGRALKFYAAAQLWSSIGRKLVKTVKDKERQVGITCRVQVKKNRLTGKEWGVTFPILHALGMDDVAGCVEYLVDEKHWKRDNEGNIDASRDFEGVRCRLHPLCRWIEENKLQPDLREIVAGVWAKIEAACKPERQARYGEA